MICPHPVFMGQSWQLRLMLNTRRSSDAYNLDQFTKDLEALRNHLGLKKFILLGHSWGGLLAMNYSVTYPDPIYTQIVLDLGDTT
jgi:proline iminopeptidase